MTRAYPVDDPSRVAEIRRAAALIADSEGLDETLSANVMLVTTEICTNLLTHAKQSEVFLSTLSDRCDPGVEILAIDRGPGMADVARCLVDGYSSTQTQGTGLGAIARLSQEFDIYSDQPRGTVLVARIRRRGSGAPCFGVVLKPIAGEEMSGDAWAFCTHESEIRLIVADGLGHGVMAARASGEAIETFRARDGDSPRAALERIHGALRATRGAAVAIGFIDRASLTIRYAGIGNIVGAIVSSGKPRFMVSHNGTAGYHSPRMQEFSYPLPEEALVVMHSDGLHSNWNLEDYPGLRRRDPSVIAGVLYRDSARNRDDACVVVAKTGASL